MTYLSWSDRYSVGSPIVDAEHKELFLIVNEFYENLEDKRGIKDFFPTLNRLIVYAEHHFGSEEKYMKLAGYPEVELREHMRIHEELVDEVFHLYARLRGEEGGATSGVDVGKFIEDWLSNHILDVDKRCEPYFRKLTDAAMT